VIYRLLFHLVLRRLRPEIAHALAARVMRAVGRLSLVRALLRRLVGGHDPRLRVRALGLDLPSPLGAAAGTDKDATWFEALGALGFGFVEVGTITARAHRGNPRPRVFRLPADRALVNSMGFPNPGADVAAARLRRRTRGTVVGVNVGKSRDVPVAEAGDDYRASLRHVADACEYVVLNVSSPNTPQLRQMQAVEPLAALIDDVRAELRALGRALPLLVKIAPDMADEELDRGLDGIVAVNTTVTRDGLTTAHADAARPGGLSGPPLKERALAVLARVRARVGDRLVLVSVGGIETPEDAWERILAGATLVQAYTGFVYGGPLWPRRINRGLAHKVSEAGAATIQDLVGTGVRALDDAGSAPAVPPPARGPVALAARS
jgi:dihydroorotate dehydrogenase